MASAARRKIIGGVGGAAPIIENRRRRPQIDGGDATRPAQGSKSSYREAVISMNLAQTAFSSIELAFVELITLNFSQLY